MIFRKLVKKESVSWCLKYKKCDVPKPLHDLFTCRINNSYHNYSQRGVSLFTFQLVRSNLRIYKTYSYFGGITCPIIFQQMCLNLLLSIL